jgi:hypothetical protein
MGFMDRLLGRGAKPASAQPVSRPAQAVSSHAPSTRGSANSPQSVRKELVRVCTRETLVHNGIPAAWIKAEPLTTAQAGRESGVHVRLLVQHWDPRLMYHAVAIQELLEKRILALDPQAEQWLMGMSWQFALQDVSQCPPLPHPGSWTQQPGAPAPQAVAAAAAPADGDADVISGPTRIRAQQDSPDARKELERMLSERDADFRKDADDSSFGKTQPMGFDKTQPMGFDKTQPMGFDKTQPPRRE